ncbi:glycosyltransferase family 9 protein, partial [candidate division KSB1 bacterium]|nr:glycosyltransferase family 9 protein [candidate division KSB1 bacterium]
MQTIDRILISRLRFMGDIILTTPLLHQIRLLYPHAHITYLAETPYHTLLQNHPDVDRILAYRRSHIRDQLKLAFTLLNETFDLAIDLFGNPRSGLMIFLSGAAIRIGGDFRLRRHFYTHRIADDGT